MMIVVATNKGSGKMLDRMARFVRRVEYLRRTLLAPPAEPDLSPQNIGRIRGLLSPEEEAKVVRLLGEWRKIEAMKVVRDVSGAGLMEAKAVVENIAATESGK